MSDPYAQAPVMYPAPPVWPAPARMPAAAPAPRPPALTRVQAPAAPRPVVRLQAPEDAPPAPVPPPAPLTMPAPDHFGVGHAEAGSAAADWAATRARLAELGAVGFQLDRLSAGGWVFTCWMPTSRSGVSERIEARAATEAEAVALALDRAGRWKARP